MTPPFEAFDALFDPRGVVVAGASSHPGKFGFVVLHNILSHGYRGRVFATNRDAAERRAEILGVPVHASVDELPGGAGRSRGRVHPGARPTSRCSGRARPRAYVPHS